MTPKEVLITKLSAVVDTTEIQKESTAPTEASHQEMSVASKVERVSLPPSSTETHG